LSDGIPEMIEAEVSADIGPEAMRAMHLTMLRIRKVEEKVADLVERGEIVCPCHLYIGEEAVAAGVCSALRRDDWVFSTHRSHGHYIAKGGDIKALMAEMYGRATGCSRGRGGSMHLAAPDLGLPGSSAIVAGTISLALGAALAFQLQGKDSVAVPFFGDGAANEGVFYECLNLAALKKLPVVFVCENNLYSTHMPVAGCLANVDIYRKAEVCGMPGVRVDGNSAAEVYRAATEAIENARRGGGPTLIECMTYRWRGHVGPNYDLDKGLRSKEEVDYWMERCPIKAVEEYLLDQGFMSESDLAAVLSAVEGQVEEAVAFARSSPFPDGSEVTANVFKA